MDLDSNTIQIVLSEIRSMRSEMSGSMNCMQANIQRELDNIKSDLIPPAGELDLRIKQNTDAITKLEARIEPLTQLNVYAYIITSTALFIGSILFKSVSIKDLIEVAKHLW